MVRTCGGSHYSLPVVVSDADGGVESVCERAVVQVAPHI